MSHGRGGRATSIGNELSLNKKKRKNHEFADSIARIAVAQICQSVGLQGSQQSALDTLSDITCKYIQETGTTSNFYANLAGRTASNVFDILRALEDLGLSQGFAGASDLDHCSSGSGIIKDLSHYIGISEEVGFAYSVPPFPVIKERHSTPTFFHAIEDHIPPWLPCFPDPKTYTEQTEATHDKIDQDQKIIDPILLKSKQSLACNVSQLNNPFLAAPLEYGEKEVSLVSLPPILVEEDVFRNRSLRVKHVSALKEFAPLIQGIKRSNLDTDEDGRKIVVERRQTVQLKFHMCKKSLPKIGNVEAISWFADDGEKNMRNEKNVKESMENGNHSKMA